MVTQPRRPNLSFKSQSGPLRQLLPTADDYSRAMFEALGLVLIVVGGAGIVLVALFGYLDGRGPRPMVSSIKIDRNVLVATADLTPRPSPRRAAVPATTPATALDTRLADDLFAEVFALRADVAAISSELRNLRQRLDGDAPADFTTSLRLRGA